MPKTALIPPCHEEVELVTFEKVGMDFISLKGIQTKIGVGTDKLLIFVLKELVDNALDFIVSMSLLMAPLMTQS